uniref:Uncharacterized protein n=1 Tax=Oryza glumipatula TaxID=40148 RepID=A0A0E0A8D6_9ORYZ
MAAVLGACSRAPVARSRSDAVTARNGVGLGGMEMALKGDDGTEGEQKLGVVDTSWPRNLITASDAANLAATLPPIHHLADMCAQPH